MPAFLTKALEFRVENFSRALASRPAKGLQSVALLAAMAAIALHVDAAHAQAIDTIAQQATGHISTAFGYIINAICFIGGGSLLAIAIFGWWQHQRNPNAGSKPTIVLAGFICGGLLLAFPFVAKTASFTMFGQGPSATGAQQQMQFNQ